MPLERQEQQVEDEAAGDDLVQPSLPLECVVRKIASLMVMSNGLMATPHEEVAGAQQGQAETNDEWSPSFISKRIIGSHWSLNALDISFGDQTAR
ncbi:Uu.00g032370.m01.CDS01 [Anthostomella pinea]|uniref:Uu.00g032370.m01.CDS01 n=1 Tax=Anthostomella pinea TaxID=933095 RepID=A0AAI8YAR9_9PEZI|nr:Uu.00g032370.m01.CDS01 [Anthostomella pinea]